MMNAGSVQKGVVRAPGREDMRPPEAHPSFFPCRDHWAREIDLAIAGHQQLDRLNLPCVGRKTSSLVNELIGEVFDGVPKFLQRVSRIGTDPKFAAFFH